MGRLPKKLKLQHTAKELKMQYQQCKCSIECRRIQVIWLLAEGRSHKDVQTVTALSDWSMPNIIARYNEEGLLGLKDRRHNNRGTPTLLNKEELLLLDKALLESPAEGGRWNGRKVAGWIKKKSKEGSQSTTDIPTPSLENLE